jgi:hypothetical protein
LDAIPLATKAVTLAPLNPAYLDTLAAAISAAGLCGEAMSAQSRALGRVADNTSLSDNARAEKRAQYAENMRHIQKTCVDASQSASALLAFSPGMASSRAGGP